MTKCIPIGSLMIALLILVPHGTFGQQLEGFQYAVKFVCGKGDGNILAPGRYFTAINVHNPTDQTINFSKKFAIALPGERPGPYRRPLMPSSVRIKRWKSTARILCSSVPFERTSSRGLS
jgi:hypothetical protein